MKAETLRRQEAPFSSRMSWAFFNCSPSGPHGFIMQSGQKSSGRHYWLSESSHLETFKSIYNQHLTLRKHAFLYKSHVYKSKRQRITENRRNCILSYIQQIYCCSYFLFFILEENCKCHHRGELNFWKLETAGSSARV